MADEGTRIQARLIEEGNRATLQRLEGKSDTDIRTSWLMEGLRAAEGVIAPSQGEAFAAPRDLRRFLPAPMVVALQQALDLAREVNDELVGLRLSEAQVVLDGDPRVLETRAGLRRWADDYAELRLARRHPADLDDPFLRFWRVYTELTPRLEDIAFRPDSATRCFMADMTDYLPWTLFDRTWRPLVEVVPDDRLGLKYRSLVPRQENRDTANRLVELYKWNNAILLDHTLERADAGRVPTAFDARTCASDLLEMRPFLDPGHKPAELILEAGRDLRAAWLWRIGPGVGTIALAASSRELQEALSRRELPFIIVVRHDGVLAPDTLPWLEPSTAEAGAGAARLLHSFHTALVERFSKIDLEAIVARWIKRDPASPDEPGEEELAASCALAASTISEEPPATDVPTRLPLVRALRSQTLFRILSDRLGCEVRSGKGSEVVLWRDGGHHFRLGHHRRNSVVPPFLLKSILRHLAIGFDQWVRAIG